MLKNYLKVAIRNLRKNPEYSFINIFGLAIGIALCLLILMYVRHELSYDQFHENADRIVRVNMVGEDEVIAVTPSMVAPSLSQISPEIEGWVRLYEPTRFTPAIVTVGQNHYQENSFWYADSSFFDVFTFKFLAGDKKTALEKPKSLVLTESTATKLFGDAIEAVGKTVTVGIYSDVYFEVTGVIEDVPSNSHFSFNYLGSLNTLQGWSALTDSELRAANLFTYLLLSSPQSQHSLEERMPNFTEKYAAPERDFDLDLLPLNDLYLRSNTAANYEIGPMGDIQNVYGFAFLAFMVLLIATSNYINLATARSVRRAAEVGVRKALGAARGQITKQFYGESIIITLIAVVSALVFIELTKGWFFSLMGQDIQINLLVDPVAWAILGGVVVITSLLAGSYPALLISSYQPINVLSGLFGGKNSDGQLRKSLVVFQFAISTFLILSTVIIYQQTDFVLTKDLGFDEEQIVVLPTRDNELSKKQDLLKSEVLRQSGVMSVTYMSNVPGKIFGGYLAKDTPGAEEKYTMAGAADQDLVETMGIELLAGNGFPQSAGYSLEQGYKYLINESLAQEFGWTPQEAIGQPFNVLSNREGEVVGVMKNFNFASLHENIAPLALFMDPNRYNYLLVKISGENMQGTLTDLENMWSRIAPHRPFEFDFMDQQLNILYDNDVRTRNLLFLFSGLAIIIACLGLIGLSSFLIERKAQEIGIRKVLGASVTNIVTLLTTDFLKLVGIGFLIGAPVAWYVIEQWLQNFAYRIEMGPGVFLLAGLAAVLIALATVSWQSVKAALMNPVNSLRSE